jgi:hypothetical protein
MDRRTSYAWVHVGTWASAVWTPPGSAATVAAAAPTAAAAIASPFAAPIGRAANIAVIAPVYREFDS